MGGASRFAAIASLVISGIIIADIIAHPTGTAAAAKGTSTVLTPTYNALLGKSSS